MSNYFYAQQLLCPTTFVPNYFYAQLLLCPTTFKPHYFYTLLLLSPITLMSNYLISECVQANLKCTTRKRQVEMWKYEVMVFFCTRYGKKTLELAEILFSVAGYIFKAILDGLWWNKIVLF